MELVDRVTNIMQSVTPIVPAIMPSMTGNSKLAFSSPRPYRIVSPMQEAFINAVVKATNG